MVVLLAHLVEVIVLAPFGQFWLSLPLWWWWWLPFPPLEVTVVLASLVEWLSLRPLGGCGYQCFFGGDDLPLFLWWWWWWWRVFAPPCGLLKRVFWKAFVAPFILIHLMDILTNQTGICKSQTDFRQTGDETRRKRASCSFCALAPAWVVA